MQRNRVLAAGTAAGSLAGLAALADRYLAGVAWAGRPWPRKSKPGFVAWVRLTRCPSCR
jgi:hypothetical protein